MVMRLVVALPQVYLRYKIILDTQGGAHMTSVKLFTDKAYMAFELNVAGTTYWLILLNEDKLIMTMEVPT